MVELSMYDHCTTELTPHDLKVVTVSWILCCKLVYEVNGIDWSFGEWNRLEFW